MKPHRTKRLLAATGCALTVSYAALLGSGRPAADRRPDAATSDATNQAAGPSFTASFAGVHSVRASPRPTAPSAAGAESHARTAAALPAPPAVAGADDDGADGAPTAAPEPSTVHPLAQWMIAAIRSDEWDGARTAAVERELATSLERLPNLRAEQLECGKRFCRAIVVDETGNAPQLQALLGAPPFDGEGFTTPSESGSMQIFFTRSGQSLDALRQEARL